MSGVITVREATREDLDGLCRVAGVTWRVTYAGILSPADIEDFLDRNYQPDCLQAARQRHNMRYLVAVDGDEVVGYATTGIDRQGQPTLFAIYVLPDRQGLGIGTKLWAEVIAHARDAGHEEFLLWVHEDNAPARRFYEQRGAVPGDIAEFPIGSSMAREVMYRVPVT